MLVLEAGTQVGGAALTREFAPGFRVSAGAHLLHRIDGSLAGQGAGFAGTEVVRIHAAGELDAEALNASGHKLSS